MLVGKPLGFLGGVSQDPLALIAQRQIHRSGNLLTNGGVTFDLLADRFHRGVRAQEAVGQGLVFAQKPQQQVLRLNVRRPELAGFIAREKDDAPCLLRITFKHIALFPSSFLWDKRSGAAPYLAKTLRPISTCNRASTKFSPETTTYQRDTGLRKTPSCH